MTLAVGARFRAYCAALLLSAAALGAVPELRVVTPAAIVRPSTGRRDPFAPVERIDAFVLTTPLVVGAEPGWLAGTCAARLN
jgi:hypothetical protein